MTETATDRLLTMAEVAEWFGTGVRFPRRLVAERRIRFVKVGKHVRFPESAVREFLEAQTIEAVDRRGWGD